MKKLMMLSRFCEIAKEVITTLDEEGLEYDFMCNQVDIDEQGPCCSDSKLMKLFKNNIKESINEDLLYQNIEQICINYIESFRNI